MDFGAFSDENLVSRDCETVFLWAQLSRTQLIIRLLLFICVHCGPHWPFSMPVWCLSDRKWRYGFKQYEDIRQIVPDVHCSVASSDVAAASPHSRLCAASRGKSHARWKTITTEHVVMLYPSLWRSFLCI